MSARQGKPLTLKQTWCGPEGYQGVLLSTSTAVGGELGESWSRICHTRCQRSNSGMRNADLQPLNCPIQPQAHHAQSKRRKESIRPTQSNETDLESEVDGLVEAVDFVLQRKAHNNSSDRQWDNQ